MTERRQRSATESLLSVACGVEMATVLFGAIAIAGLHKQQWLEVLISAIILIAMLALAQATLRRGLHPIVYASQALLALPVVTEPMWGLAWLVCIIFFTYCLVKGQQLDRRKEQQ
ncbi:unannotated protein [freshwater metagenome]|uniref:Unannotated protein n=1 Tax=freshwater metagenome TaxID=449393 RepID=A0A6J7DAK0_9ZZZZ|nr:hypothetical protein [Actinomycetota bacterium]